MRRINFESGKDTHISMEDVLNAIDQRGSAIANTVVNDAFNREAEMSIGATGGLQFGGAMPQMIGGSQSGLPPTLSQEYLQFVDGTDEVPEWIKKKYWGIITRMNQLTQIKDERELARVEASIRAMIRPFVWKTKVTSEEMFMIQHYTKTQVLKAYRGVERRLIAPQLQEITRHETYSDGSVLTKQNQHPGMVRGAIDSVFGR
jgi:hypothetical protein